MDDEDFLNFLTKQNQDVQKNLDVSEAYSEISEDLNSDQLRYTDIKKINEGGIKSIFSVHDRITDRYLAMAKLKEKNKDTRESFLREARITASLQHPNIMPVHDIGFDSADEPYFTMKLIHGKTFTDFLKGDISLLEKLNA